MRICKVVGGIHRVAEALHRVVGGLHRVVGGLHRVHTNFHTLCALLQVYFAVLSACFSIGEALGGIWDGQRQDGRERGIRPKRKRKRGEQNSAAGFEFVYTKQDPNLGPANS